MPKGEHRKPWADAVRWELRRLIAEQHLRQTDLAELTGLSQSTVSRLLNGTQDICLEHLDRLAEALGTTPLLIIVEARRRSWRER